jgi:hypothetical protein
MIVMLGDRPVWYCDACYTPFTAGHAVVYSGESVRGALPSPKVACSERCAQKAAQLLSVEPVKRLSWDAFVKSLLAG